MCLSRSADLPDRRQVSDPDPYRELDEVDEVPLAVPVAVPVVPAVPDELLDPGGSIRALVSV